MLKAALRVEVRFNRHVMDWLARLWFLLLAIIAAYGHSQH